MLRASPISFIQSYRIQTTITKSINKSINHSNNQIINNEMSTLMNRRNN